MRLIYLLILPLLFLGTNCKTNSPKVTTTNPKPVETSSGVEIIKDTLVRIANRQLNFAKTNSIDLPFSDNAATTNLILVRHAEKAGEGEDPELTREGQLRAERLADILQDFPLDGAYATSYARTTKTAQPTAYQQQIDMQFYDAKTSADFIIQLAARNMGKNFLVVGHSNTVPQMLNRLLGESKFANINEADYNNIYVVSISKDGGIKVIQALF